MWLFILQEVKCPKVNCVNGNATILPGSCCPVCGKNSIVAKSPCLHNHTFMSIEVCENGDKEYLPGEAFNIDCNTW